ncbi:MAG: FKBP-type peptidyl-prolyl cis-trans isomerase [Planctomycetota bacterium]|jgi:FKBP-type peptidyl-prolyl cis-trans isomerase
MADVPAFSMPADDALQSTASGLKYETMTEGSGAAPAATDTVTVHYAGWLTDGTPFDSSYSRGQTASFPLNRVISGWTEGLQLMKEGGTTKFVIPPDLGYGAGGAPPVIGPNATLVFQVELISVG